MSAPPLMLANLLQKPKRERFWLRGQYGEKWMGNGRTMGQHNDKKSNTIIDSLVPLDQVLPAYSYWTSPPNEASWIGRVGGMHAALHVQPGKACALEPFHTSHGNGCRAQLQYLQVAPFRKAGMSYKRAPCVDRVSFAMNWEVYPIEE